MHIGDGVVATGEADLMWRAGARLASSELRTGPTEVAGLALLSAPAVE